MFNSTYKSLISTDDIFRASINRLRNSTTTYSFKQLYEVNPNAEASYSKSTKSINIYYDGIKKEALAEEVFHAGQDDFYSFKGIKRSALANEVEAKVVNLLMGYKDDALKKENNYNAIKGYFETGKKDRNFTEQLNTLISDVFTFYQHSQGANWAKNNKPENLNMNNLFQYLESIRF